MDEQVYARVVNGKIVEYPVYERHIKARGHDKRLYKPCIEINKPDTVSEVRALKESKFYSKQQDVVFLTYELYDLPLEVLLDTHHGKKYTELKPVVRDALLAQLEAYITRKMDEFAQTRRYDTIASCASYACDGKDKTDIEGKYAMSLIKKVWSTVPIKINEIVAGIKMVPTVKEVDTWLPEMKWPAMAKASVVDIK